MKDEQKTLPKLVAVFEMRNSFLPLVPAALSGISFSFFFDRGVAWIKGFSVQLFFTNHTRTDSFHNNLKRIKIYRFLKELSDVWVKSRDVEIVFYRLSLYKHPKYYNLARALSLSRGRKRVML